MALSLAQVVAERTDALLLLEEAYDARIGTDGGRAVVLDSMLEAAREKGFYGSVELAAGVLRASGRFRIEKGPRDKWQALRQSAVPASAEMTTEAMTSVPVAAGSESMALIGLPAHSRSRALVPIAGPIFVLRLS